MRDTHTHSLSLARQVCGRGQPARSICRETKVMLHPSFDDIHMRPATNRDAERVTALVSDVLAEFGLRIDPTETDADLRDIEKNYIEAGGTFELIEDERGNLLGTVGLYRLDAETC